MNSHNAFVQECSEDKKEGSSFPVLASDFKIVTALIMHYRIMRRDTCIDLLTEKPRRAIKMMYGLFHVTEMQPSQVQGLLATNARRGLGVMKDTEEVTSGRVTVL